MLPIPCLPITDQSFQLMTLITTAPQNVVPVLLHMEEGGGFTGMYILNLDKNHSRFFMQVGHKTTYASLVEIIIFSPYDLIVRPT